MNLSQDHLKAFYEVSRLQSFTKAAAELGLTQSALSHRIRNLEDQLETTLFVRDPAGLRTTEAGSRLLQFCRLQTQIESELLADLTAPADKKLKGFLRIGAASTLLSSVVIPALSEFLATNTSVQFEMIEAELSKLPELLQNGKVDMIVTCGAIDKMHFEGLSLGEEINTLVEAKGGTLRTNTYIDTEASDPTSFNFLKLQGQKKPSFDRCYMHNINGIIAGVEAGLGKAILPKHLIKQNEGLRAVKGLKEIKTPVYLYNLKQPFYSKLHQAVFAELEKNVGKYLK